MGSFLYMIGFRRFKRTLLAFIFLFCSSVVSLHAAVGLGFEGGLLPHVYHSGVADYSLGLSFRMDKVPLVASARVQMKQSCFAAFEVSADMWLANPPIGISMLRFFYGVGANVCFSPRIERSSIRQSRGLFVAPRFLLGANTFLTDFAEVYVQAAVEPGLVFDSDDGYIFRLALPLSAGFF